VNAAHETGADLVDAGTWCEMQHYDRGQGRRGQQRVHKSHLILAERHLLLLDDLESRGLDELLHLVHLAGLHGVGLDHGVGALRVNTATAEP
jgi:hypothetical protein